MTVHYRNMRTGRVVERQPDGAMDRSTKWQRVDPEPKQPDQPAGVDDPSGHTVRDVNAYLAGADPDERRRVLAAEADGKARVRILNGPHGE